MFSFVCTAVCHGRLSSKCNTLKKNFGGRFPTKTLTRTVVDDAFDELNRLVSNRSEVKAFWEEKTDNIVGVLVRSTLPRLMRLGKVNKSGIDVLLTFGSQKIGTRPQKILCKRRKVTV